jgi:hypothetical protein
MPFRQGLNVHCRGYAEFSLCVNTTIELIFVVYSVNIRLLMGKLHLITIVLICSVFYMNAQQPILVLKGGTIIDVDDFGSSTKDLTNSIIIIQKGKILSVGSASSVKIPKGAKVIDITGKYVVPGLIDCFGAVNNQAYANAYLYSGVTTVVVSEDLRRGKSDWTVNPSPQKLRLESYWGANSKNIAMNGLPRAAFENLNIWPDEKISRDIDSLAKAGVHVLLIHYGVRPQQLPAIVAACRKNNIPTVGELGLSDYGTASAAGIQSFVHTSRYTADILPDSVRKAYSTAPFGPPARYYYDYVVEKLDTANDPKFLALINTFSKYNVGLIPTASLIVYPEMPFFRNPWLESSASIIDEKDVHEPFDKITGKPKAPAPHRAKAAPRMLALDQMLARSGARYLSGSGTDAYGAMPGISLHTELEMLSNMGLTNRQVLAASTNNFSLLWNWKHLGKIEKGREADILVLNNNPLESINI